MKKDKLLPLKDHWIPGLTERPMPPKDPNDNWMNKIYTVAGYISVALVICLFLYFIIYGI